MSDAQPAPAPDVTPGSQTSENQVLKDVMKWGRIIIAALVAVFTSLLATGAIPKGGQFAAILAMVLPVLTQLVGEQVAGVRYAANRTALKVASTQAKAGK